MAEVAEPYIRRRAIRHLEAAHRRLRRGYGQSLLHHRHPGGPPRGRIEAELLCKGTHSGVDGVYSADPKLHPTATRYEEISFMDVISKDLRVMDLTVIMFCKDNDLPIRVFDLMVPGQYSSCARRRRDRYAGPLMDEDLAALVKDDTRDKMAKAIDHVRHEMSNVRTGRASSALPRAADGGLLRDADSAAPAGRFQRPRRHAPGHLALRQGLARIDREGHHGLGPGNQPHQ